jgi:CHASE2 domain-containing sensor protein
MQYLVIIITALHLSMPLTAMAQIPPKTPLSYSLAEYGVVLAAALLGGLANWYVKAKNGPDGYSPAALIGELCVSAFAGVIAFWLCEAFDVPPLLTAAAVGMAGHAGARGLDWLERIMKRKVESTIGGDK